MGSGAQAAPRATETENSSKRPFWHAKLTVLAPRRPIHGATKSENGSKRPFWQVKLTVMAPREVCPEQGLGRKGLHHPGRPLGSIESPLGAQDALGALRKAWGGLAGPGQCQGKKVQGRPSTKVNPKHCQLFETKQTTSKNLTRLESISFLKNHWFL